MTATILDGKALAEQIRAEIAEQAAAFIAAGGAVPCLAAVLVGDDPASQVYVRNKQKACEKAGHRSQLHRLPAETTQTELLALIDQLNRDPAVHGILVQLPLPKQIDESAHACRPSTRSRTSTPSIPRTSAGSCRVGPAFCPARRTASSSCWCATTFPIAGSHVVVLGRSDIVGKPMAIMLMQRGRGGDATVTVCHSRTARPARQSPARPTSSSWPSARRSSSPPTMVKPGAVVIDVGINRTEAGLVGDVDFDAGPGGGRPDHARARRRRPADDRHALAQHFGCGTSPSLAGMRCPSDCSPKSPRRSCDGHDLQCRDRCRSER